MGDYGIQLARNGLLLLLLLLLLLFLLLLLTLLLLLQLTILLLRLLSSTIPGAVGHHSWRSITGWGHHGGSMGAALGTMGVALTWGLQTTVSGIAALPW